MVTLYNNMWEDQHSITLEVLTVIAACNLDYKIRIITIDAIRDAFLICVVDVSNQAYDIYSA